MHKGTKKGTSTCICTNKKHQKRSNQIVNSQRLHFSFHLHKGKQIKNKEKLTSLGPFRRRKSTRVTIRSFGGLRLTVQLLPHQN